MAGIEDYKRPWETVLLERIKVEGQVTIPDSILANAQIGTYYADSVMQTFIRITSEVLAFERGRRQHKENWTQQVVIGSLATRVHPPRVDAPLWPLLAFLLLPSVVWLPNVGDFLLISVVSLVVSVLYYRAKIQGEDFDVVSPGKKVTIYGTATIPVAFYDAFPYSKVAYPKDLGRFVEFAIHQPPEIRVDTYTIGADDE